MITRILSHDLPRSRLLSVLLVLIFFGLLLTPFAIDSTSALNVAAKIMIFIVLVASFDLLLGYTGIFSFAHTMFFGIGAYGVAIASTRLGPTWDSMFIGIAGALLLSLVLSFIIGLMSLRVRALFYALITLAVATAFAGLASQMSHITGGEDGLTFRVPELLRPGFMLFEDPVFGLEINGRIITYYLIFVATVLLFLAMLRIVNSPFGRVLQAIRENDFRAEALGYRVVVYRVWSNILGALFATLAGCMLAFWLRYNGTDTSLAPTIMIEVLLTVFLLAQNCLQHLMKIASEATSGLPVLPVLLDADRWLLWLGVLFVLSVYYFPMGIVGKLRSRALA